MIYGALLGRRLIDDGVVAFAEVCAIRTELIEKSCGETPPVPGVCPKDVSCASQTTEALADARGLCINAVAAAHLSTFRAVLQPLFESPMSRVSWASMLALTGLGAAVKAAGLAWVFGLVAGFLPLPSTWKLMLAGGEALWFLAAVWLVVRSWPEPARAAGRPTPGRRWWPGRLLDRYRSLRAAPDRLRQFRRSFGTLWFCPAVTVGGLPTAPAGQIRIDGGSGGLAFFLSFAAATHDRQDPLQRALTPWQRPLVDPAIDVFAIAALTNGHLAGVAGIRDKVLAIWQRSTEPGRRRRIAVFSRADEHEVLETWRKLSGEDLDRRIRSAVHAGHRAGRSDTGLEFVFCSSVDAVLRYLSPARLRWWWLRWSAVVTPLALGLVTVCTVPSPMPPEFSLDCPPRPLQCKLSVDIWPVSSRLSLLPGETTRVDVRLPAEASRRGFPGPVALDVTADHPGTLSSPHDRVVGERPAYFYVSMPAAPRARPFIVSVTVTNRAGQRSHVFLKVEPFRRETL